MTPRLNCPIGCIHGRAPQQRGRASANALFTALAALALCACGALDGGTGSILPGGKKTGPALPDPIPNPSLIMATFPDLDVDILGLPGALPGEGTLQVQTSRGTVDTQTASDGSFVLEAVPVSGPEVVILTFADEEPFSFELVDDTGPNLEWSPIIVPSLAGGVATFLVTAHDGQTVIAANPRTGKTVAEANETADSWVSVSISARSGDAIRLYLLASDGSPLSEPLVWDLL